MQIYKLDVNIWRHSIRKIKDYPFFECMDMESVRALTLESLKNEEIAFWMDKLLQRNKGFHSNLLKKSNSSNVVRQLNYVSQILISSVIKNDIGVRGGVAAIFNEIDIQQFKGAFDVLEQISLKAIFVNMDVDNFSSFSLIDLRKNRDDYIIPYSTNLHKINVKSGLLDQIKLISEEIIERIIGSGEMLSDCAVIAIDFFVKDDLVIPFECHFPGRGLGVHLLPFLIDKETANMTYSVINRIKKQLEEFYGLNIALDIRNIGSTTFHDLDKIIISMISNNKAIMHKAIDLDINRNETHFSMRDHEIKNSVNQMVISSYLNKNDLYKIKEFLGNWIIIKTRRNTPWWSELRKKPEILIADDKLILRVNYLLRNYGEIILQQLITDSIDIEGHAGELRTYYFIMR